MKTTFYIHIGVHKTGTKSIQQTLSENRRELLRHGINSFPGDSNHGPTLISLISEDPHEDVRNIKRHVDTPEKAASYNASMRQRIDKTLAHNRSPKMVISGEGLSGRSEEEINRLKEMLAPYAGAYRIIVYVRDHYEYTNSASQQRLKSGATLDVYAGKIPVPRYRRRISPYIKVFGRENVDIRVFNTKRFVEGDLISDFLVAIGESPELAKSLNVVRANQAMSHEAAMILSETNKVIPNYIDGLANRARASAFPTYVVQIEGEKFAIDPTEYMKYQDVVRADIEWLDRTIGETAFDPSTPRPPSTARWSEATVRSIEKTVSDLALKLQKLEKDRRLPRGARPTIPAGLEWLRKAYGENTPERADEQLAAAPQFDQATIRALGCFIHAIALAIQHLQAEQDALKGRLLIWISRHWAENHFRQVVRLNPGSARGQYLLSQALLLRGHFGEARKAAEAAAGLAPDRGLFKRWLKLVKSAERLLSQPLPAAEKPVKPKRKHPRRAAAEHRANQRREQNASGPPDQHR